jgi:hypothetical protein
LICTIAIQINFNLLVKVTYYEQQDLFDHEGVDLEDGQTTSTVEGKKKL